MNAVSPRPIVFVGNARCYHTMDWVRTVRRLCPGRTVAFATDLIESEGHTVLVTAEDDIRPLFNIDRLLFRSQSRAGNIWRNLVKLLVFPVQVARLRQLARQFPDAVYHAHTMYYMFVCWRAGLNFVGTPQGSEVLVRPDRSRIYRYFAIKSLQAARVVTVDSVVMRDRITALSGVNAKIVQNGVDVPLLLAVSKNSEVRTTVLSIRGMTPLYRISALTDARARCCPDLPVTFIYPFWDEAYRALVRNAFIVGDHDLGRLDRAQMFQLLGKTFLTISIPSSDSSPRSVYEAIFAGSVVAATSAPWLDALTDCMQKRVFRVDLEDPAWLSKAIDFATSCSSERYLPSPEAMAHFDQEQSMRMLVSRIYDAEPTP